MKEYRVIRLDTGSLVTRPGYYGVVPETQHGTFLTHGAAVHYMGDLLANTNTWWATEYGYQVQAREVTPWEDA